MMRLEIILLGALAVGGCLAGPDRMPAFSWDTVPREDYVAKGIEAIQKVVRSGTIIAFTIGMGNYADTDMDDKIMCLR